MQTREERNAYRREWYRKNKEKHKRYYLENVEKVKRQRASYHKKNKEAICQRTRVWKQNNPGQVRYNNAKRRAARSNATPTWLRPEQQLEMLFYYLKAQYLSEISSVTWHVDHIEPLIGKQGKQQVSCGLHVPWNLQVITEEENLQKGNTLER